MGHTFASYVGFDQVEKWAQLVVDTLCLSESVGGVQNEQSPA